MRSTCFAILGFASIALALPLAGHAKHRPLQGSAEPQKIHKVEKVAENIYCIFGQGGNIGLVVTARHAVLIDDQYERIAPGLLEAIRSVTDKPIKYLINTHFHGDHTGGNLVLEKQVMAIVAHTNVRKRLETAQARLEPGKRGGLPELALGEEDPSVRARLDIHLDGTDLHLVHFGPGHTDGDVMVGIPAAKVLHMGDLFFNGLTPYIDLEAGGSLGGLIANAEKVLAFLPEDARVIPGHGPVGGKKEVARFRDFLRAVESTVKLHPGVTGKELDAAFDHKAWSDFKELGAFLNWERFFDLAAGRQPKP